MPGSPYVLLHGKAVMLLVGYQPDERTRQGSLQSALRSDRKGARIDVCVDDWQSSRELGHADPEPLLLVHIRSPDRPGAALDALDSLREILRAEASGLDSIRENDWSVWYARIEVKAGNAAHIQLTLRLSIDPQLVKGWEAAKLEEIERKVRQLAARKAAGTPSDKPSPQENAVISVQRIAIPNLR